MKADASNSAAIVAENKDLLTEILLRVPAKPLLKLMCVSKQWLSVISNPQFCHAHTRRREISYFTPSGLLLCPGRPYGLPYPGFKFLPLESPTQGEIIPSLEYVKHRDVSIFQSCEGLLLCSSLLSKEQLEYFIYNPTTEQLKTFSYPMPLKMHLQYLGDDWQIYVSLAFEPKNWPYYKVFFILSSLVPEDSNHPIEIYVYSSDTDSWTTSLREEASPFFWVPGRSLPVFYNGAIHLIGYDAMDSFLFYFDVNTEIFRRMPQPAGLDSDAWADLKFFGESQGHLHVIAFPDVDASSCFDVFEMANDCSGWFVRYHVNLHPIITAFPELIWTSPAMSIIRAKNEEESRIVIVVNGVAFIYNLYNGTWKKYAYLASVARRRMFAYQYTESLICV